MILIINQAFSEFLDKINCIKCVIMGQTGLLCGDLRTINAVQIVL